MTQFLDISKSLQFARQNLPIVTESNYLKIIDRMFTFVKRCDEKSYPEVVNLCEIASNKWHWNFMFLEAIRAEWVDLELSELMRVMKYLKVFLKITICNAVHDRSIEKWADVMNHVISNSLLKGIGIVYYLADIYISEVEGLEFADVLMLVGPFVWLMKTVQIPQLIEMLHYRVFCRLKDLAFEGFSDWVFKVAMSTYGLFRENMHPLAREKLYDLFAIIKGENIPERSCILLVNSEADKIGFTPNKLQKVLKNFYKRQNTPRKVVKKEEIEKNVEEKIETPTRKNESINMLSPTPQKSVKKAAEPVSTPKPVKKRGKKPAQVKQKPISRKKSSKKSK